MIYMLTAQWNVVFDDWFSTVTSQPDNLPDFNADEWAKMFGTSTYYIPTLDDHEDFDTQESVRMKQELDDPMFDEFINQDIALSNPLTQPHKTYSKAVQQNNTIKQETTTLNKRDNIFIQTNDQPVTNQTRVMNSPIKLPVSKSLVLRLIHKKLLFQVPQ